MNFSARMIVIANTAELYHNLLTSLSKAVRPDEKGLNVPQIVQPGKICFSTWYYWAGWIENATDIAYCESKEWIESLTECSKLLGGNGIIMLLFKGQADSFAYTTPLGMVAGSGDIPDDWACDFADDSVAGDLINLIEELSTKDTLTDSSDSVSADLERQDTNQGVKISKHTMFNTKSDVILKRAGFDSRQIGYLMHGSNDDSDYRIDEQNKTIHLISSLQHDDNAYYLLEDLQSNYPGYKFIYQNAAKFRAGSGKGKLFDKINIITESHVTLKKIRNNLLKTFEKQMTLSKAGILPPQENNHLKKNWIVYQTVINEDDQYSFGRQPTGALEKLPDNLEKLFVECTRILESSGKMTLERFVMSERCEIVAKPQPFFFEFSNMSLSPSQNVEINEALSSFNFYQARSWDDLYPDPIPSLLEKYPPLSDEELIMLEEKRKSNANKEDFVLSELLDKMKQIGKEEKFTSLTHMQQSKKVGKVLEEYQISWNRYLKLIEKTTKVNVDEYFRNTGIISKDNKLYHARQKEKQRNDYYNQFTAYLQQQYSGDNWSDSYESFMRCYTQREKYKIPYTQVLHEIYTIPTTRSEQKKDSIDPTWEKFNTFIMEKYSVSLEEYLKNAGIINTDEIKVNARRKQAAEDFFSMWIDTLKKYYETHPPATALKKVVTITNFSLLFTPYTEYEYESSTKTVYDHGISFRISTADLESYITLKFDMSPAKFFTDNAIMKKPGKKPKDEKSNLLDEFYKLLLDYLINDLECTKKGGYDRPNIGTVQSKYIDDPYDELELLNLEYGVNIWDEDDKRWNGIALSEISFTTEIERDGIIAEPTWKGFENYVKRNYKMHLKDYLFTLGLVSNERKKLPRW